MIVTLEIRIYLFTYENLFRFPCTLRLKNERKTIFSKFQLFVDNFLVLNITAQLSVVCLHIQKKPSNYVTVLRIVLEIVQSTTLLILIVITTVTIFSIMMWMRMMKSGRCSCGFCCCCLGWTGAGAGAGAGTGVDVAVSARVQHSLGFVMQKKRLSARLGDRHTQSRAGVCTTPPLSWTRKNKSFVTEQVHSSKDSRFITVSLTARKVFYITFIIGGTVF